MRLIKMPFFLIFLILMLTDARAGKALFLFAHQDDEFGVFARIEQELRAGRQVCCVYATDGAATAVSARRDAESQAVLQKLGVPKQDILFVGRQLGISDGKLHLYIEIFVNWLSDFIETQKTLDIYFVPAWEGGHPDHDLLHAVAVELLAERDSLAKVWQYPLYNSRNSFLPFFHVQSPMPENGCVTRQVIFWSDRLRYIRLCLAYPSQWRTWIGLFPFVFIHYLFNGTQQLQRVNRMRLSQRPHLSTLYYEYRNFLDWPTVLFEVNRIRSIIIRNKK